MTFSCFSSGPLIHILNFLSTTDFCKFDIALCNKIERSHYLKSTSESNITLFLQDKTSPRGNEFITWTILKNISIKYLRSDHFTDLFISELIQKRNCLIHIEYLDLSSCDLSNSTTIDIIKCPKNLLYVALNRASDSVVVEIAASCTSLHSLSFKNGNGFTGSLIVLLSSFRMLMRFFKNDNTCLSLY